MYGGKWVSFMGIPPLTLVFLPMILVTLVRHRIDVKRRTRKMKNAGDTWNKSWF